MKLGPFFDSQTSPVISAKVKKKKKSPINKCTKVTLYLSLPRIRKLATDW